jgi:uncharacterized membrane protein YoaK (UPF0700 family)
MKLSVPALMSFNGGYVDTAGFLALQGLFTAHVTGNFVTLGYALTSGTAGVLSKLLALPVFFLGVMLTGVASRFMQRCGWDALAIMLGAQSALLAIGAALAITWGPFPDGDAWRAVVTGLTLVFAMAIQNAAHRLHLANFPPTTLMTGTVTQIALALEGRWVGHSEEDLTHSPQLRNMALGLTGFASGCGAAALCYIAGGAWAFVIPPAIAAIVVCSPICDRKAQAHRPQGEHG